MELARDNAVLQVPGSPIPPFVRSVFDFDFELGIRTSPSNSPSTRFHHQEIPPSNPRYALFMRRGDDLANRLLLFAATVLRLVAKLPTDQPSKDIARQLSRAATGAGANYAEARGAESRPFLYGGIRTSSISSGSPTRRFASRSIGSD